MRPGAVLACLLPVAIVAAALDLGAPIVFALSAAALVPAAHLLGDATEDLAVHAGPRLGGLLNTMLGGSTQLILAFFALRAGLLEVVKASLVGSIIASLLLVLGLAAFVGGLRNGAQYFDRRQAGLSGTLLILAVIALAVPAMFGRLVPGRNAGPVESLSEAVAVVMVVVYLLSLYFSLVWHVEEQAIAGVHRDRARWTARRGTAVLAGALAAVVVLCALLVDRTAATIDGLGVTGPFIGVIVFPLVGTVAQHIGAVELAWRNRMDLATEIAMGTSLQIVLLVTPLLIFASLALGTPMDLVFADLELAALGAAAMVAALVSLDGESHWLEGVFLLAVYLLMALAFFWWPAPGAP